MADETQQLTQRQLWHKKYYQANRERLNEYQMAWHNANREERLKYQREYNKKYYQANRQKYNRKAVLIEKMMSVTETVNASASSSKPPKAEKAEKAPKVEKAVAAVPSQWEIPPDAKPWTFVEPPSPKRQVHRPLKKKPVFQFVKGQFELSFD